MKKYLKELDKDDIEVRSAGIHAIDGIEPTKETVEVMKKEGVDVSCFRSRSITDELIKGSDLILVMAAQHMDYIINRVPEAASKTHVLRQFAVICETQPCEDLDIVDPIGKAVVFYEGILAIIKKEMKRVAEIL